MGPTWDRSESVENPGSYRADLKACQQAGAETLTLRTTSSFFPRPPILSSPRLPTAAAALSAGLGGGRRRRKGCGGGPRLLPPPWFTLSSSRHQPHWPPSLPNWLLSPFPSALFSTHSAPTQETLFCCPWQLGATICLPRSMQIPSLSLLRTRERSQRNPESGRDRESQRTQHLRDSPQGHLGAGGGIEAHKRMVRPRPRGL